MSYQSFQGGVHPLPEKDLTKEKAVTGLLPVGELIYPLSQHIGAPAKAVVSVGDRVLAGQVIGEASGWISAEVLASVSGTVTAIGPRLLPGGAYAEAVVVENDGAYEEMEGFGTRRSYETLSAEEIRRAVKAAGIVGMGGAGFPTHVKLTPQDDNAIESVIINGSECEPYLTADYRLMLEESGRVIRGLKVILHLFPRAKGVIVLEENKSKAAEALRLAMQGEARMELLVLPERYPQGAERGLVAAVTGKRMHAGTLPFELGCIVCNVSTAAAVGDAVCASRPLLERIVTVTGEAIRNPGNFRVRLGTSCAELVEAAGGFAEDPAKVLAGGPMMGHALSTLEVPVIKTTSALVALTFDAAAELEIGPCIRCGRCISACPVRLVPQKLREACERYDLELFEKLYGMECYECGSCTYICPARLPLTQSFMGARRAVSEKRRREKA